MSATLHDGLKETSRNISVPPALQTTFQRDEAPTAEDGAGPPAAVAPDDDMTTVTDMAPTADVAHDSDSRASGLPCPCGKTLLSSCGGGMPGILPPHTTARNDGCCLTISTVSPWSRVVEPGMLAVMGTEIVIGTGIVIATVIVDSNGNSNHVGCTYNHHPLWRL